MGSTGFGYCWWWELCYEFWDEFCGFTMGWGRGVLEGECRDRGVDFGDRVSWDSGGEMGEAS